MHQILKFSKADNLYKGGDDTMEKGVWMQSGWWINNAAVGLFPEMRYIPRFAGLAKFDTAINCFHHQDGITLKFQISIGFNTRKHTVLNLGLTLFIFWHFEWFDQICCCVRSCRSKSLVRISGGFLVDFYRIGISGKLGWWKNWLAWKRAPIKTFVKIHSNGIGRAGCILWTNHCSHHRGHLIDGQLAKRKWHTWGEISFIRLVVMSESIRACCLLLTE